MGSISPLLTQSRLPSGGGFSFEARSARLQFVVEQATYKAIAFYGMPRVTAQHHSGLRPETPSHALCAAKENSMQRRNNQIIIRLDDDELAKFKRKVAKSGLSQSAYVRFLIRGLEPKDRPSPDYRRMLAEVREAAAAMKAIANVARRMGILDADVYDRNASRLLRLMLDVIDAVETPGRAK
jgi:hypothetical protein